MLFSKHNEFTPFPVSDNVKFRNYNAVLHLKVRSDGGIIVRNLKKAQERLKADAEEKEKLEAAKFFASAIFGEEQAEKLLEFYNNDSLAVISVCSDYFSKRLSKIINKVQKKRG